MDCGKHLKPSVSATYEEEVEIAIYRAETKK